MRSAISASCFFHSSTSFLCLSTVYSSFAALALASSASRSALNFLASSASAISVVCAAMSLSRQLEVEVGPVGQQHGGGGHSFGSSSFGGSSSGNSSHVPPGSFGWSAGSSLGGHWVPSRGWC